MIRGVILLLLLGATLLFSQPTEEVPAECTNLVDDRVLEDIHAGYEATSTYVSNQKIILWDEAKDTGGVKGKTRIEISIENQGR